MKLLLTSDGFVNPVIAKKFLEMVNKQAADIRLLFIPTASRSPVELKYVDESRKELIDMGLTQEHIVDIDLNHHYSDAELQAFDVVYVCGGNTFYLLSKLREHGFDKRLIEMVQSGKVYIGVSAGSVIAGQDASIASPFDENDVGLMNTQGLCFVDCVITPHFDKKEHSIIEAYEQKSPHRVVRLRDGQALMVTDEEKIILT